MKTKFLIILLIAVLVIPLQVYAHEGETHEASNEPLEADNGALEADEKASKSLFYVTIGSVLTLLLIIFAIFYPERTNTSKMIVFVSITTVIVLTTGYLVGSTIYLNIKSETGGPVHWHADFELWNCGEEIDLKDPKGLSNRIGSPVFHEHNDNRIHVEGVVVRKSEVDIDSFFDVVGGELTSTSMKVPTDDGTVSTSNGESCNGKDGEVQIFVYRTLYAEPGQREGLVYEQIKVDENYVMSPFSTVPPGDCIIVEFDEPKEETDKICETYELAIDQGRAHSTKEVEE